MAASDIISPRRARRLLAFLALALSSLLPSSSALRAEVVFSEIMYHDGDPERSLEYLELYNPDATPANLGGHSLVGGIRFTFEPGTVLAPGGYLVVAADAEDLASYYGIDVAGEYQGRLNNNGETLVLFDPSGGIVERISYADTWPWPVVADGGGPSLERIDFRPAAHDDPGAWLPAQNAGDWRLVERIGHATTTAYRLWLDAAGVCLIDDVQLTPIDNPNQNLVPNGSFDADVASWAVAGNHRATWEAAEGHAGPGCLRVTATAAGSESACVRFTMKSNPTPWGLYRLTFSVKWVSGARVLEGRFASGGTPCEVPLYGFGTPGKPNSAARATRPPLVRTRQIVPAEPRSQDAVTLYAAIEGEVPITGVVLRYEVNFAAARELPMSLAGSGIWSCEIPPQNANSMVRYRIIVTTAEGDFAFPRDDDPTRHYGYFVFDGGVQSELPLAWLFMSPTELARLNSNVYSNDYVRASMVFGREVYDDIRVRYRGGSVRPVAKKYYKVKFNRGRRWNGQNTINMNSEYVDYSRIRTHIAHTLFEESGVLACQSEYYRMYLNGAYQGVYLALEDPEAAYLSRQGRDPAGNLYKSYSTDTSQSSIAGYYSTYRKQTNREEDWDDLVQFITAMDKLPAGQIERYIEDHVNVDRVLAYVAMNAVLGNLDWGHKNHYFYHDPETGKWEFGTWDVDLVMGKDWDPACGGVFCHQGNFNQPIYMGAPGGGVYNRVTERILGIAAHRARYEDFLRAAFMELFTEERMIPWIEGLYAMISPDTVEEIKKFPRIERQMTEAQYWAQQDVLRGWVGKRRQFVLSTVMIPVTGLSCAVRPDNTVEVAWKPATAHTRDAIKVDGATAGTIAGTLGRFVTAPLAKGQHEICVLGVNGTRTSPPTCCSVTIERLGPPASVAATLSADAGGASARVTWKNSEAYTLIEVFTDRGGGFVRRAEVPGGTEECALPLGDLSAVTSLPIGVRGVQGEERSDMAVATLEIAIPPVNVVLCTPGVGERTATIYYQTSPLPGDTAYERIEILADGMYVGSFDPAQHPQFYPVGPERGLSGHARFTLRGVWFGARPPAGDGCEIDIAGGIALVRGDANSDGSVAIADAIALLGYVFGKQSIPCLEALDVDDSGSVNVSDAVRLLRHLYGDGPPPAPPFPSCGLPPGTGLVNCVSFPACAR